MVGAEVWLWSLDAEAPEVEALAAVLSPDERARAGRFAQALHRDRWIVARGRMRQLLGEILSCAPQQIRFSQEAYGRPVLASDHRLSPSFNLSHSEGVGALAVSFDARIGVDVEAMRPMGDDDVEWALSRAERLAMSQLQGRDRVEAFFRFWTLKEAFMKALGLGMSLPLDDFDISAPGTEPRLARLAGAPDAPGRWRLVEHRPAPGFKAAVCALTEGRGLDVTWRWTRSGADASRPLPVAA